MTRQQKVAIMGVSKKMTGRNVVQYSGMFVKGGGQMKSTGIIRKVDELGRIVIPIELRRTLDIAERDELEIFMDGEHIVLRKFEPFCVFCSSSYGLVSYKGKNVCRDCVSSMKEV